MTRTFYHAASPPPSDMARLLALEEPRRGREKAARQLTLEVKLVELACWRCAVISCSEVHRTAQSLARRADWRREGEAL